MVRLFLDANILFSAGYRPDPGILALWKIPDVVLVTSNYALEEAWRNLRGEIELPEQDWAILGSASASGATHLITGDLRDFGAYFGERILGVLILRPAEYLRGLPLSS